MLSFKNDYCFAYLPDGEHYAAPKDQKLAGFYLHDIRHLSQYEWCFDAAFQCVAQDVKLNELKQHYSMVGHHLEQGQIRRQVTWKSDGFTDCLSLYNPQDTAITVRLKLNHQADFMDLFALRSEKYSLEAAAVEKINKEDHWCYRACLQDGSKVETQLKASIAPSSDNQWDITLEPKQHYQLTITATFHNDDNELYAAPMDFKTWQEAFAAYCPRNGRDAAIYNANIQDLYYLLLCTRYGFYPAAGTPLFVTAFGRDSLITADFLTEKAPFLAKSVLAFAASLQGQKSDSYHEEEKGKIFHEIRRGTLAKLGKIPFSQYYGTADATALWLKLFGRYMAQTDDMAFLQSHAEHIQAAYGWIMEKINHTGYIQFMPEGQGLSNQNWKDSPGSNCHADGKQAEAPIANVEVQAYAYAALGAASDLFAMLGQDADAQMAKQQQEQLFARIQKDFWLEDLGFYAMGLDAKMQPLKVCSSNIGHLLWCKAVPEDKASRLIERLLAEDMYSGWGLRTLSSNALAYDPLGYHVGTVWPHDTAIFALGASSYGDARPKELTKKALLELAMTRRDLRLPEVSGGFTKQDGEMPIPYVRSCIPQTWAAAALIALF